MPSPDQTAPCVSPDVPLATLAIQSDGHAAVLDRHRLDFCCGGRRSLRDACAAAGLDVQTVVTELDDEVKRRASSSEATIDWTTRPLANLVVYIVNTHHAFTRTALARIEALVTKVAGKHAERHPELRAVARAFGALAADLSPHMLREEQVLFPYICSLESDAVAWTAPPFGTVANPVRRMMQEHEVAGELLGELMATTNGFVAPPDACGSYRALFNALAELRRDLMLHVSLENSFLFPRALAVESRRSALHAVP